jgi:hypothetical protein
LEIVAQYYCESLVYEHLTIYEFTPDEDLIALIALKEKLLLYKDKGFITQQDYNQLNSMLDEYFDEDEE